MKRAKNLYPLIPTHENLRKAFWKAAKGRRSENGVVRFLADFDGNIENLREQILKNEPDIGHYRFFEVRDPKRRTVCAAAFPERVLHHAVMNICEPFLDACAIHDSYACRKGKGNRKALARAQQFARNHDWYLKLDISKYFDSVDHAIALRLLGRRFKDAELTELFGKILDTHHTRLGKGIPIGNLFSQHLANFYLNGFDHWIKEVRKIRGYVRYMDDFILFAKEKEMLATELEEIRVYLRDCLALTLKGNIQLNRCRLGIPFLGFRVFPGYLSLLPQSRKRFSKKYRKYEKNYADGKWSARELVRHMEPLTDFTNIGEGGVFRRMVIERFGVLS